MLRWWNADRRARRLTPTRSTRVLTWLTRCPNFGGIRRPRYRVAAMRVLILNQAFPPDRVSSAGIFADLAVDLLHKMLFDPALGPRNFCSLPYQPAGAMPETFGASDLCLAPLVAGIGDHALPSKVYLTMAAEKPVFAVADRNADLLQSTSRR